MRRISVIREYSMMNSPIRFQSVDSCELIEYFRYQQSTAGYSMCSRSLPPRPDSLQSTTHCPFHTWYEVLRCYQLKHIFKPHFLATLPAFVPASAESSLKPFHHASTPLLVGSNSYDNNLCRSDRFRSTGPKHTQTSRR